MNVLAKFKKSCSCISSWISKTITRIMQWLSFSSRSNRNQKRNTVWVSMKDCWLYNIPIGNVKKLVPIFFYKKKYVLLFENLQFYLRLGLKLKRYIAYSSLIDCDG